jgi:hypothetical protein
MEFRMLDRPAKYDAREINRKARKYFVLLHSAIADLHGRPTQEIRRLANPSFADDPSRRRQPGGPQLSMFSGPGIDGEWCCRGNGASGKDLVSLIQYLSGGCEYRVAADWLSDFVNRIVEVPAA